ncbi:hypothetical protein T4A_2622 [Trichinella pseudospiralis]|uniref:Uncharacterized protein n=1 Tax=Trichinella pseudospiralis TaxID=6337 RepID=A0A0V1DXV5_TRIPS|nr:hypothetical protein T4A_2622 [Trichinella pseudospiralis]
MLSRKHLFRNISNQDNLPNQKPLSILECLLFVNPTFPYLASYYLISFFSGNYYASVCRLKSSLVLSLPRSAADLFFKMKSEVLLRECSECIKMSADSLISLDF